MGNNIGGSKTTKVMKMSGETLKLRATIERSEAVGVQIQPRKLVSSSYGRPPLRTPSPSPFPSSPNPGFSRSPSRIIPATPTSRRPREDRRRFKIRWAPTPDVVCMYTNYYYLGSVQFRSSEGCLMFFIGIVLVLSARSEFLAGEETHAGEEEQRRKIPKCPPY
nr:hypothetical protein Iba_chr06bCG12930 [Ipomoea batatas]